MSAPSGWSSRSAPTASWPNRLVPLLCRSPSAGGVRTGLVAVAAVRSRRGGGQGGRPPSWHRWCTTDTASARRPRRVTSTSRTASRSTGRFLGVRSLPRRAGLVALRDRLRQRPGPQRGQLTGPNPTDRGKKGSKIHLIVDRHGLPLSIGISAANLHDSQALIPLVRGVPPIRSRRGPRRRRPRKLHGDKGLRLRSPAALAVLPRHPAPPRPQGRRVIPTPGQTPLGRGTDRVRHEALCLYPRLSREELGRRFLGRMTYLDPKGEGDNSMSENQ